MIEIIRRVEKGKIFVGVAIMDRIMNQCIQGVAWNRRLEYKVEESRLRWFGDVRRSDAGYVGRRMLEMDLPGKRNEKGRRGCLWMQ